MNFSTYFQLPQTGQIIVVSKNNKNVKVNFTKLSKGLLLLEDCKNYFNICHYSSVKIPLSHERCFCDFGVVRFNEQVTEATYSCNKSGYSICQDNIDTYDFLEGAKLAMRRLLLQDEKDNRIIENIMRKKNIIYRTKDFREQKLKIFLHEKETCNEATRKVNLSIKYSYYLNKENENTCIVLEANTTKIIDKKDSLEIFILTTLFDFIHNVCKNGYFYEGDVPLCNLLKGFKDKKKDITYEINKINQAIKEFNIFTTLVNKEIENQKLKIHKLTEDLISKI